VFGNLFKFNDDRKNKINLLIFLTPRVVHDEGELREYSVDQRDRFQIGLLHVGSPSQVTSNFLASGLNACLQT